MVSATVAARAALAGNPSDGYGGAVTSVPVPALRATVEVVSGSHENPLVAAVVDRWAATHGPLDPATTLHVHTSIPRSVGLAGSSAIVIAGLRALARRQGTELADDVLIGLAHAVEREDLGIAGGWQDQISQVVGRPVAMEFEPSPAHRPLRAGRSIPFFVAWDPAAAESSSTVHARPLDDRAPELRALAEQARVAADAFEQGDVHRLKAAMEATLDLRFALMPIAPRHREMAELARSLGVPCNFAGSGGAIIGVLPKDPPPFLEALEAGGLTTTTWEVA